jgi:hypothetical protein
MTPDNTVQTPQVEQRRICWPNPDATCLEGGCLHCDGYPFRDVATIEKYARTAGIVPNRAIGEQDAWTAFLYGRGWGWSNVESRTVRRAT